MELSRALELCQEPLDASRSHLVQVDRYALTQVLADRVKQIEDLRRETQRANRFEKMIGGLTEEELKAANEKKIEVAAKIEAALQSVI